MSVLATSGRRALTQIQVVDAHARPVFLAPVIDREHPPRAIDSDD